MKLESVKQNPRISQLAAESRYWLQRWAEAFDPLYRGNTKQQNDLHTYMQTANMRLSFLILYIYTAHSTLFWTGHG